MHAAAVVAALRAAAVVLTATAVTRSSSATTACARRRLRVEDAEGLEVEQIHGARFGARRTAEAAARVSVDLDRLDDADHADGVAGHTRVDEVVKQLHLDRARHAAVELPAPAAHASEQPAGTAPLGAVQDAQHVKHPGDYSR